MGRRDRVGVVERRIEYSALPSQLLFHQSQARFKGFSGPIGSGKSQALCQEAIRLSYVNAGRAGFIGAPTYPMLRDSTQAALFELLERSEIPYDFSKAENIVTMRDAGSKILFRPVEEFERLRGTNLAWFGIDELTYCPEEAWLRMEGRLRDPLATRLTGFAVWTPKGFDWVHRRFIAERVEGYQTILVKPFENRHLLSKVPDFYERLKQSYDERFYLQEVLGQYLNTQGGLVYHQFDRRRHIRDIAIDSGKPLLWALDFNVEPMCSVVAQIAGEEVRVLDEIVLSRGTTHEACEEFHSRFSLHAAGIRVYGDASGNSLHTSGTTDYRIIREFFSRAGYPGVDYRVPKANPSVRERVSLMNARLENANGDIRLYIGTRCRELIKDLEQVSYKDDTTVIDKLRDSKRTHLSDALGYLLWQECHPRLIAGERNRPLL